MLIRSLGVALVLFLVAGCGHAHRASGPVLRFRVVGSATQAEIDRTVEIVRNRVDKLGASDAEMTLSGRVISIRLPGVRQSAAAQIIGKQGLLEFYDFEADLAAPSADPVAKASLRGLLDGRKRAPRNTLVVTCDNRSGACPELVPQSARTGYLLFKHIPGKVPEMTGKDLRAQSIRADVDPGTGEPIVVFQFTDRGKRIFREITRREAHRGALVGSNCSGSPPPNAQHFAIVLDRQIESVPYID